MIKNGRGDDADDQERPQLKVGALEMSNNSPEQLEHDHDEEDVIDACRGLDAEVVPVCPQVMHGLVEDDHCDRKQQR
jgi:hypothetical protein